MTEKTASYIPDRNCQDSTRCKAIQYYNMLYGLYRYKKMSYEMNGHSNLGYRAPLLKLVIKKPVQSSMHVVLFKL